MTRVFRIACARNVTNPRRMRTSCMQLLRRTNDASQSFFSSPTAAIALNRTGRCGKTALKIFFGIPRRICPARLDLERNRANRSPNDSGGDPRRDASEGRNARAEGARREREGRFHLHVHDCRDKAQISRASMQQPEEIMRAAARNGETAPRGARSDEHSALELLTIRASSSGDRSRPAGSPCRRKLS
jgi:hypothetical protein